MPRDRAQRHAVRPAATWRRNQWRPARGPRSDVNAYQLNSRHTRSTSSVLIVVRASSREEDSSASHLTKYQILHTPTPLHPPHTNHAIVIYHPPRLRATQEQQVQVPSIQRASMLSFEPAPRRPILRTYCRPKGCMADACVRAVFEGTKEIMGRGCLGFANQSLFFVAFVCSSSTKLCYL